MRNLVCTALFFISLISLKAQEPEIFGLKTAYYPLRDIKDSSIDGEIGFKEFGVNLTIPQVFNDFKTILSHTVRYNFLSVDANLNLNNSLIESTSDYHLISYAFNLIQKLKNDWRINVGVSPSLASDFNDGIKGDDWLFQGNVLFMKRKNPSINYGFGAAISTRFGRELLVPILLFNYKTPKRTLSVTLPNRVSLMYNTKNKNFYYGGMAALNGALFNVSPENPLVNDVVDEAGYSRLNIGLSLEVRLKGGLYLRSFNGIALARRLELINSSNDTVDRTPQNGPIFNLGIVYLPTRRKNQDKN